MIKNTLYRDILKKSWQTTFNNKIFWFFGIFATPLLGGTYEILKYTQLFSTENALIKWSSLINTGTTSGNILKDIATDPLSLIMFFTVITVFLFILLFFIWIAVVSQASLINAIDTSKTKEISHPNISKFISSGIKNFWSVFAVNAIIKFLSHILLILASVSAFALYINEVLKQATTPTLIYLMFITIFIPLTLILGFIGKFAINFIIIKKDNFWDALKNAYKLFIENWLISFEMGVLLLIISFAFVIMFSSFGFLLLVPFWLISYVLASLGVDFILKIMLMLSILTVILVMIFAVSILSVFQYSCWVLLFKKLTGKEKVTAKLHRILK